MAKVINLKAFKRKFETMRAEGRTIHHEGMKLTLNHDMAQVLGDVIWDSLEMARSQVAGAGFLVSRDGPDHFTVEGWDLSARVTRDQLAAIGVEMLKAASQKSLDMEPWRRY